MQWLDARGVVPKHNAWIPSFCLTFTKSGFNSVTIGTKKLGFRPICFRGHFEEIGTSKVLLGTKSRRVGKFRGCRLCSEKKREKKKKTSVKYNGLHALATLERATIKIRIFALWGKQGCVCVTAAA